MSASRRRTAGLISTAHSLEAIQEEVGVFSRQLEGVEAKIARLNGHISKLRSTNATNGYDPFTNLNQRLPRQKTYGPLQGLYAQLEQAKLEWSRINAALACCYAKLRAINDWLHMSQSPEYHAAINRAVMFNTNQSFSAQATIPPGTFGSLGSAHYQPQERVDTMRASSVTSFQPTATPIRPDPTYFTHCSPRTRPGQGSGPCAESSAPRSRSLSADMARVTKLESKEADQAHPGSNLGLDGGARHDFSNEVEYSPQVTSQAGSEVAVLRDA